MAWREQMESLIGYHFQTSIRLTTAAAALETAVPAQIREKMEHLLRTAAGYRIAMETGVRPERSLAAEFPDLAAVAAGFRQEKEAWAAFCAGLAEADFGADMTITTGRGPMQMARWRLIQQVVLHGMQHHAECAELLTAAGASPGNIDFIFYDG